MFINYRKYAIVRVALAAVLMAGLINVRAAKAETVGFGWVQGGGGTNLDYGTAMALDVSGNVYVSGLVLNAPANQDAFINKWDANGDFLWSRFFAGSLNDASYAVALDVEGNVYVSGSFSGTVVFDPGNSAGTLTSAGLADAFLVKFDGDGNFIWVKSVGGTSSEGGNGLAVDSNGDIYMTGSYAGTSDFDPGAAISNLTSVGSNDVFVSKFDSNGNFIWAKSMGGPSYDTAFDIAVHGTEDIFFTGYFADTADFDPSAGIHNLTSAGGNDLFINKLDGSGNLVWVKHAGGLLDDTGIELALDGDGNIVVTGFTNHAVSGTHDILVDKWDGDGNLIWTRGIGGTGWDTSYGIAVDGNDNIYITGDFSETVDFDPGTGTSNLTSAGSGDIFICKLDSDGNFIWAEGLGGTGGDLGEGIALDGNGDLYLMGSYADTVDFDPGPGTTNLTSAGSSDIFISKLALLPQIHYVKWNANGSNDGTSWEHAYTELQSALSAASSGDEIWVASGSYKPTLGTDRTISFVLKNGVAVYGGFAGTETARAQRNYHTNLTILSGDIGAEGNNSDNSYHVLVGSNTDNSAILDGFTITAGNANDVSSPYRSGGGMYTEKGAPRLNGLIFAENHAGFGGGLYTSHTGVDNPVADLILTHVVFRDNTATVEGGGLALGAGNPPSVAFHLSLTDVVFENNTAVRTGGGLINNGGELELLDVTFLGNTAMGGGGLSHIPYGPSTLTNVTFSNNYASEGGGGILVGSSGPTLTTLTNVTFNNNSTVLRGGGIANAGASNLDLTNVTFSGNTAGENGGGLSNGILGIETSGTVNLIYTTFSNNTATSQDSAIYNQGGSLNIHNSILYGDTGHEIVNNAGTAAVTHSIVRGGYIGTGNIDQDPLLGPLQDNGGFTETMALGAGSPAIDAGNDTYCPATDQRGVTRPQGVQCDIGAYEYDSSDSTVDVTIGNSTMDSYVLSPQESIRDSYPGVNDGPVKITNADTVSMIAAERLIYRVNGVNTSFSEMMGLPASRLDNTYWLPWYNNVDLDTQLRFANVSTSPATVTITIGGQPMGNPIPLAAGASTRVSFAGVNNGPVKIQSDVNIVAAERVIYKVRGVKTSFTEMMALPNSQLDNTYWLPWYNNVDLDTQLRIANVSSSPATVTVTIGGVPQPSFNLAVGESTRVSYSGVNNGPVKIESTQDIVAAERVIYRVKGINTSFSEMMALPNSQLDNTYWLPWYNNVDLDTQLRIANVSGSPATVTVTIGGISQPSFNLAVGESTRVSYSGVNNGPVRIISTQNIVAAERVIYRVNGVNTSFSEMMALPDNLLDSTFWFPWYNNVDLDTQLRFGVP